MTPREIINLIDKCSRITGHAPATITGRGVGNTRLYSRLVEGGYCSPPVEQRLRAFIESLMCSKLNTPKDKQQGNGVPHE